MANASFNPFNIGPPDSNASLNIKIPTCPSYPPPVHAVTPQFKVHTNRSVSQDSMPEMQLNLAEMKGAKSQIGEVAISKAINEEMATFKQLATATTHEHQRIHAGGGSEMSLPHNMTKDGSDTVSLQTLMPVRVCSNSSKESRLCEMGNGFTSKSSVRSKVSRKSHVSDVTKASRETEGIGLKSQGDSNFHLESTHSAKTVISNLSKAIKDSRHSLNSQAKSVNAISRISLKSKIPSELTLGAKDSKRSFLSKSSNVPQEAKSDKMSTKMSMHSHASQPTKSSSTIKSRATLKSSKKSTNISIKSSDNNISLEPPKDTANDSDQISHYSVKSTNNNLSQMSRQTRNVSHHSIHLEKKPSFRILIEQKKSTQAKSVSQRSINKVKDLGPSVSKQLKSFIKDHTPSKVIEEANVLANRLKAGNVSSFRRLSPLISTYTNPEPEKLCRDDRMSQWFKEAVLS
ncbi:uncharacterized protein Dwil_GK24361, isoform C [Drosophila willistoni]|uniref:Uncharacterized protein, isoform B n=1 Tax=Drosophila willistoni TaxID=7260 RepID=A0A0Q9WR97_DROWI|nr:uncharacterized protein Dwil_GK24361, isoform B [Drosophila willistoni]KRF98739.1 uncharacterized protein Dwil_GK24361, isoform C [Drosophila willistoni]